jgi:hypothetical protein
MSSNIDRITYEDDLLGGVFSTPKRAAITGSLARRAIEAPDERFTQTMIRNELIETGKRIQPSDVSSVFRLLEHYGVLARSDHPAVFGFGIVEGQTRANFWRAAQLVIRATEAVAQELPENL